MNSDFLDFVNSKTDQVDATDWGTRKTVWLNKVSELHKDIESWLAPLVKSKK